METGRKGLPVMNTAVESHVGNGPGLGRVTRASKSWRGLGDLSLLLSTGNPDLKEEGGAAAGSPLCQPSGGLGDAWTSGA